MLRYGGSAGHFFMFPCSLSCKSTSDGEVFNLMVCSCAFAGRCRKIAAASTQKVKVISSTVVWIGSLVMLVFASTIECSTGVYSAPFFIVLADVMLTSACGIASSGTHWMWAAYAD